MSKKQPTDLATTAVLENALAVADGVDTKDARGKGNITQEDTILPRLAICQNTSPEKDPDDAKYIDGLKEGDLFNSLTGTIYGRAPVTLVIVDLRKRALEFEKDADGKQTKVILDWNVPWDDARCEFTDGPGGVRQQPRATRFYDYIAYVPATMEAVVLSMSRTKVPKAKRLNSLLALRPGPSWAGQFAVSSVREEKNGQKFYNFKIDPAGRTDPESLKMAEALYEQFATKDIKVDQETEHAEAAPVADDTIPF